MRYADPDIERMYTGIAGLDRLLDGGIVRGNSMLIEGPPGSGKTTFAVRIIAEGIQRYGEPGLIITFEEFPRQIYKEALGCGIDLEALEKTGMLRVVWTPPSRILEGFTGKSDLIEKLVDEMGIKRLVIDSITHFKRVANDEVDLREVLAQILNNLKIKGINAFLIKELERIDAETIAFEEYLVDASMRVYNNSSKVGGENTRFLEIRKSRGQRHISGFHPFQLNPTGVDVYPSLSPEDLNLLLPERVASEKHRIKFGVHGLDEMLCGGLWSGSLNLISGYSGTGKSVLGYHFLDVALKAGETGMIISINNTPQEIVENARSLGMDWNEAVENGRMEVIHIHPVGLCLEQLQNIILERVIANKPDRLVFDSLQDIWNAVRDEDRIRHFIQIFANILGRTDTTTVMIQEMMQMGGAFTDGHHDYSFLSSCVIQLSMAESDGELKRFICVRMHNGSNHAKMLREYHIDQSGLHIQREARGLTGILTGQTQGEILDPEGDMLLPLEEVGEVLQALIERAEKLPDEVVDAVRDARSQLGLADVLLREHFGQTEFREIVVDIRENK